MYFATGEGWFNADAVRGLGLWKSTDGGATWEGVSSTNAAPGFRYCQDMVILDNGDLLVGTRSFGLQRSQDGGQTWSAILASASSVSDIEIASNGDIYVGFGVQSNGRIFKSTDQGENWTTLHTNPGIPSTGYDRVELALAPSNSNRVYAMMEDAATAGCFGIFRSDNGEIPG